MDNTDSQQTLHHIESVAGQYLDSYALIGFDVNGDPLLGLRFVKTQDLLALRGLLELLDDRIEEALANRMDPGD